MCDRGGVAPPDLIEFDDPAMPARSAGVESRLNNPVFSGFGQFGLYILALEKQRFGGAAHKRFRETDELM
jgi:hypothetical protein